MTKREIAKLHFHRDGRVTLGKKGDVVGRIDFDIIWTFEPTIFAPDVFKSIGRGRLAVLKADIRGMLASARQP